MQGYFLSEMKTGLVVMSMAIVMSLPVVVEAGTCSTNPSVTIDAAAQDVLPGGSVDYTLTLNSTEDCDVDITLANDTAGFSVSQSEGDPIPVVNGVPKVVIVTVTATNAVNISTGNITTVTFNGNSPDPYILTSSANNRLLHNSFNLGSSKWGVNGWGLSAGKYGEFDCDTCHGRNTGNIKRVKASIPATIGAAVVKPVNFQATTGANSFGDDSSIHATSTRICEVCHTYDNTGANGVTVHAYNMPVTSAHENNNDCISCHSHSTGFAASCSSCHGDGATGKIWPDGIDNNGGRVAYADDQVGAHDNHIQVISQELFGMDLATLISDPASTDKQKTICAFCHPSPGGGGHDADGGADSLVDMQPAGSFKMFTVGANNYGPDTGSGAYNFVSDSCSNLVCHNQIATPTAGNGDWLSPPANPDCTLCHLANGGTQRHDTHVGSSGKDCTECHADNGTFPNDTIGVDHINGDVDLVWSNAGSYEEQYGDSSVTYTGDAAYKSGPWGTCASVACHSNSLTPTWDSTGAGCTLCHSGTETTGAHEFHMHLDGNETYGQTGTFTDAGGYDFGCADCHSGDSHVNGSTTVTTNGFNSGTKSCATASCHSYKANDGVTTQYSPTPAWDTGSFAGDRCAGCHGNSPISAAHEEHQVGFHYRVLYSGGKDFLPINDSDPLPTYLVTGANGKDQLRAHGGLLDSDGTATSTTITCYVCHNDTVTSKRNDLNTLCATCHNGSDAPNGTAMTIVDKTKHVNGVVDIAFVNEKIRSKAQVRDDIADSDEITQNMIRVNGYKAADGSSYDETKQTLFSNGWWVTTDTVRYSGQPEEITQPANTCMVSCHLWKPGHLDKRPVHWRDHSQYGAEPVSCLDCHTEIPK